MNVFDIIGPVMVGPSSSHTAGAVRIGKMTRSILAEAPVLVKVQLHGSFAKTYQGHGTDKAITGGLLGFDTDDERIRDSLEIAGSCGLQITFETIRIKDAHPNTALITARGNSGKTVTVMGSSIGGGNIIIRQINGLKVEVTGEYYTILISHRDTPGVVASVTGVLAQNQINIASMDVYRSNRGGSALMIIEIDQQAGNELERQLSYLPGVVSVAFIEPII